MTMTPSVFTTASVTSEAEIRDEQERGYRYWARQLITCEDRVATARAEFEARRDAFDVARVAMQTAKTTLAEAEESLKRATLALSSRSLPAPIERAPVNLATTSLVATADQIAQAYGFATARDMTRSQFLNTVSAEARAALESSPADLDRLLDIAIAGDVNGALEQAGKLTASPAKKGGAK